MKGRGLYVPVKSLFFLLLVITAFSGSDGLVKLWTIKTNECVKTLDAHQDKVWGLHASRKDDKMVTASADSNITVWAVSEISIVGFIFRWYLVLIFGGGKSFKTVFFLFVVLWYLKAHRT